MKIALAQINTIVGDVLHNLQKIVAYSQRAYVEGASLVVFPELALCGYPPLDLLFRPSFVEVCEAAVHKLQEMLPAELDVVVGGIRRNPSKYGRSIFNSLFYYSGGEVQIYDKHLLPSYDVFDECRYYEPGDGVLVVEKAGERIGFTICEDIWHVLPELRYSTSPVDQLVEQGISLLVNIAASPFSVAHEEVRHEVLRRNARRYGLSIVYVNQVGGQTHLLFDGGTRVLNPMGLITAQASPFEECLLWVEKSGMEWHGVRTSYPQYVGERIRRALIMAIRDYFQKLGLRRRAVLGISGGIDSAVVLALAVEALGKEAVFPIFLPSRYTSPLTHRLVADLHQRIGMPYETVAIDEHFQGMLDHLRKQWGNLPYDVTEENIQARLRQTLIMAYANKEKGVMLNTSNKSELAVGYGTLYGDLAGGISVIGDVWKTQVYEVAQAINHNHNWIPHAIMERPPSAELKPDQRDSDVLPPYEVLDPILKLLVEEEQSYKAIISRGFDADLVRRVARMLWRAEHKRYQFPNVFRVSKRAFGYGRRIPIVARWE